MSVPTGSFTLIAGHELACGDGVPRNAAAEECDDGGLVAGDGCSSKCRVERGWTCAGQPSACATVCGDGIVAGGEACDDGNVAGGDGCSATCVAETGWTCGGEPSACAPVCGDGLVAGTETCDAGATNGTRFSCCDATCGVQPRETPCDNRSACFGGDRCVAGVCEEGVQCGAIAVPEAQLVGRNARLVAGVGLADPTGTGKASAVVAGYVGGASPDADAAAEVAARLVTGRIVRKLTAKHHFRASVRLRLNGVGRKLLKQAGASGLPMHVVATVTDRHGVATTVDVTRTWRR
jgi:cysteine-rich repeat protein